MNEVGNCSALQFVQGIAIDTDGIMWVIDSGRVDTLSLGSTRQINCQPKLLLLDLKRNGSIIHRYHFPDDVASRGNNYLNRIVIDDASGGFAYITDNSGSDPGWFYKLFPFFFDLKYFDPLQELLSIRDA